MLKQAIVLILIFLSVIILDKIVTRGDVPQGRYPDIFYGEY